MFSKRYTTTDWNRGQQYTNRFVLFTGVRDVAGAPFHQGWGWCTVHPAFVKSWSDDDPRKWGSILDLNDSEQAVSWNPNSGTQVTGYLNKKYQTLAVNGADGVKGLFYYLCGNSGVDMQTWHGQDFIYMRYADVLLMHSELTGDATGLNAVRARAGLEPVAYSLDALKEERDQYQEKCQEQEKEIAEKLANGETRWYIHNQYHVSYDKMRNIAKKYGI